MCKIAVNLMLAVINENLIEVTLLAQEGRRRAPRFPSSFLNGSVVGLDLHPLQDPAPGQPRFHHDLPADGHAQGHRTSAWRWRRQHEVPMPVTAAVREVLQSHIGINRMKPDADAQVGRDFVALFETMALLSGVRLESENIAVSDGLEPESRADLDQDDSNGVIHPALSLCFAA
jgi:3-hydroxyisobutyrate dehydrogenase